MKAPGWIGTATAFALCSWASSGLGNAPQAQTSKPTTGNPFLHAWLHETLYHDLDRARSLYQTARLITGDPRTAALAAARLVDLEQSGGSSVEAAAREIAAARAIEDPSERAESLQAARRAIVERERAKPSGPSAFATTYASTERPRSMTPGLGLRRDWLETVDLALAGRFAEAEQLAWLRLGIRLRQPEPDAASFVEQRTRLLKSIAAMPGSSLGQRPLGQREAAALERLQTQVTRYLENGDIAAAAELLRRVPIPPRR